MSDYVKHATPLESPRIWVVNTYIKNTGVDKEKSIGVWLGDLCRLLQKTYWLD